MNLRTLILVASLLFLFLQPYAQHPERKSIPFDSLHKALTNAQTKKEQIDAYLTLGAALSAGRMSDSLFFYAEKIDTTDLYGLAGRQYLKGLAHYRKMQFQEATAELEAASKTLKLQNEKSYLQAMQTLGIAYSRMREPEKAKLTFETMLDFIGDKPAPFKRSIYGNLGMAYRDLGDYNKAMLYFEKCIEERPDDVFSVVNSYMNMATMFGRLEMYDEAIATMMKIDTTKIKNMVVYVAYNNNLGEYHFRNENYEWAKKYLKRGSDLAKEMKQPHLNVKPNIYLSKIYTASGLFDLAEERLAEGFKASRKQPHPPAQIDINLAASEYYLTQENTDSTIYYANTAIRTAELGKAKQQLKNVYQILAQAYEQKGLIDEANIFYKKHASFTDSIEEVGRLKTIATARARYEVAKKEVALLKSNEQKSFFEGLSIKFGIAALVLVIGCIFLYKLFFSEKKTSALREEEIESLNKKLEKNNTITEKIVETTPRLLLKSKAVIDLSELMYIKSDGPYLEFYLVSRANPEVDRNTLKAVIEDLPKDQFVQVHRSYIVNINFVRSIFATKLMLTTGDDINISRSFKANIEKVLIKPVIS